MVVTRSRGQRSYSKPALGPGELLQRLVDRGLVVPDRQRALRYLRHIGYFRFSPYVIAFRAAVGEEQLRPGTDFDAVLDLYVFDRRLRLLVMDALERIEVAVRASLTDHMSTTYGDPFWYLDAQHFANAGRHERFLSMVRKTVAEKLEGTAEHEEGFLRHTSALEHYLTTYGTPEMPPSWLVIETLTIGQLNAVLQNLARRSDRTAIARSLGLNEPVLRSWMTTYVRVRNVCAHHGRLWNLGLGVYPVLPRSPGIEWLDDPDVLVSSADRSKRLYPVVVSLQSVLATISPRSSWAGRLRDLLEHHPDVPLRAMGFPPGWHEDRFWSTRLLLDD